MTDGFQPPSIVTILPSYHDERQRPFGLVRGVTGEDHQVSKLPHNSLPGNGAEKDLSRSTEGFGLPEKAHSSMEGAPPRHRRHGNPPHAQKEWYRKSEAAGYLGVAEITITRYLDRGVLRAHRLPTSHTGTDAEPKAEPSRSSYNYGRLRIHKSELDHYLESVDRRPNEPVAPRPAGLDIFDNANHAPLPANVAPARDKGDELLTRQDAAARLGVSWRTIDRYIKSGILKLAGYFRCPDSYTRAHVFRSDVERLLRHDESQANVQGWHPLQSAE